MCGIRHMNFPWICCILQMCLIYFCIQVSVNVKWKQVAASDEKGITLLQHCAQASWHFGLPLQVPSLRHVMTGWEFTFIPEIKMWFHFFLHSVIHKVSKHCHNTKGFQYKAMTLAEHPFGSGIQCVHISFDVLIPK